MSHWTRAVCVEQCPPGASLEVVVGEQVVALFNLEGEIYALDGVCSHQGGPLGQGELKGCVVTCPWHGWQYDVRSGRHEFNASVRQTRFATRIAGEWIEVDVESADT